MEFLPFQDSGSLFPPKVMAPATVVSPELGLLGKGGDNLMEEIMDMDAGVRGQGNEEQDGGGTRNGWRDIMDVGIKGQVEEEEGVMNKDGARNNCRDIMDTEVKCHEEVEEEAQDGDCARKGWKDAMDSRVQNQEEEEQDGGGTKKDCNDIMDTRINGETREGVTDQVGAREDLKDMDTGSKDQVKEQDAKHGGGTREDWGDIMDVVGGGEFVDIEAADYLQNNEASVTFDESPPATGTVVAPVDTSKDSPMDSPIDTSMDSPVDYPVDSHVDSPVDSPVDSHVDSNVNSPVVSPVVSEAADDDTVTRYSHLTPELLPGGDTEPPAIETSSSASSVVPTLDEEPMELETTDPVLNKDVPSPAVSSASGASTPCCVMETTVAKCAESVEAGQLETANDNIQTMHKSKKVLPWKVTSFWVSPDVRLRECSVRLERTKWPPEPENYAVQEPAVDDTDIESSEEYDDEDEESEEVEEWVILSPGNDRCRKDSSGSDKAGAVSSDCPTRLLLKKCRHSTSSNEWHETRESGGNEKDLMLSAYDKNGKEDKTEGQGKTHAHLPITKQEKDIVTTESIAISSPQSVMSSLPASAPPSPTQPSSFSSLLEQCLRRNIANRKREREEEAERCQDLFVHRRLSCSLCCCTFDDVDALARHVRRHPQIEDAPASSLLPPLQLLGYRCPLCWEKFPSRALLVGHMLHTCQTKHKRSELQGLVKGTDTYYCEKCLQGFPNLKVAAGHANFTCHRQKLDFEEGDDVDEEKAVIAHLFHSSPSTSKNRLLRVQEFRCPMCWARFPSASVAEGHLKHTCVFNILNILI